MTNAVWKYSVSTGKFTRKMPKGSKVLSVQAQGDDPQMWVLVNPNEKTVVNRNFATVGTGHEFSADNLHFVGTFQLMGGSLVFHLFEHAVVASAGRP